MIAGTITFEGMGIQFSLVGDRVEYTAQDGMTGVAARKSVTPWEWAATLALMFGGDSPEMTCMKHGLYALAETAQPDEASLADTEGADAETILIAVRSVRMIP